MLTRTIYPLETRGTTEILAEELGILPRGGSPSGADVAAVQVRLGDFDAAFESLEKGYTKHEAALIYLRVDPSWDALRSGPRFQDLILRVGIPQQVLGC